MTKVDLLQQSIENLHRLIEVYQQYKGPDYDGTEEARKASIWRDAFIEVQRGQPYDETRYCHVNDIYLYREKRLEAESLAGKRDERETNP